MNALYKISHKIWQTGEWFILWSQSLITTLSKKGNLNQCKNYRKIGLICHPSKVMLKVLLQCDYCNRGHLDKVDQSDYRK